jgi:hypothetical protein
MKMLPKLLENMKKYRPRRFRRERPRDKKG